MASNGRYRCENCGGDRFVEALPIWPNGLRAPQTADDWPLWHCASCGTLAHTHAPEVQVNTALADLGTRPLAPAERT